MTKLTRPLLAIATLASLAGPAVAQAPLYAVEALGVNKESASPLQHYRHRPAAPGDNAHTAIGRLQRTGFHGDVAQTTRSDGVNQQPAHALGSVFWDDIVVTSPNPTETIYINMGVSGNHSVSSIWAKAFTSFTVNLEGGQYNGGWEVYFDTHTSYGFLTGYAGTGGFDFQVGPFVVPTNTPLSLSIGYNVNSETQATGGWVNNEQKYVFGSATGARLPGPGLPMFDVAPGVSVDSVQAGVIANVQTPDTTTYLQTNTPTVIAGETIDLVTWNGEAASPALILLTGFSGYTGSPMAATPVLVGVNIPFASGTLDADGYWRHTYVAPTGMAGVTFEFTVFTQRNGATEVSEPMTITVQ